MTGSRCGCQSALAHAGRRVVLTGGPGAGKTAVLEVVRKQFCEHVVVLSEAAGIVYGGGFPRRASDPARRAAQLAIFHVQDQLERLALAEGAPALVLCDRGVLDGLAYWPAGPDEYFREAGTTREEALARYAVVIHLQTPSAERGYNHVNALRVESAEEAAAIDRRLTMAWSGHPRRVVVESTTDFLEKLERTMAILRAEVPPCCSRSDNHGT
jgi:predicted ATPase